MPAALTVKEEPRRLPAPRLELFDVMSFASLLPLAGRFLLGFFRPLMLSELAASCRLAARLRNITSCRRRPGYFGTISLGISLRL